MVELAAECYSDRVAQAAAMATSLHAAQRRKNSGLPYVTHLYAVATNAWTAQASEDVVIACFLHDAIEDCGGAPIALLIGDHFGASVLDLVLAATDSTSADPDDKLPWGARKLAHIAHLTDASADVAVLVACDKLHNAETLADELRVGGPAVFDSFKGGAAGTVWFFQQIRAALAERFPDVFNARWDAAMATIEEFADGAVTVADGDALRARLWSHLVGMHACVLDADVALAELVDMHSYEHDGPATIRNHPRDLLTSDPHKVAAVVGEASERH